MPHKKARFDKFLSTYNFYTNSIEFRISSSKALEKWKNVQGFQLNQLVNGRFYFGQKEREILLLNYDLWSKWLYEIENFCIEISSHKNKITAPDIYFAKEMSKKLCNTFSEIVETNPDKFDVEFTKIWLEQHENVRLYMKNKLDSFAGLSIKTFFKKSVDLLTQIMQHSLIEIYELENLYRFKKSDECTSEKPFLVVNYLNDEVFNKIGICLISERLEIYKKYFDISEICIKNYTSDPINPAVADSIESTGTIIDYKMSSRFGQ